MALSDKWMLLHLLNTNEPPRDNDLSYLRTVVIECKTKIAEVQSFIQEKKKSIKRLVVELDGLYEEEDSLKDEKVKAETILSPVRRIPNEIVEQIFEYLPLYVLQRCNPSNPLVLAQICSRWRRIAHGTPRLWNQFTIFPVIDSDYAADFGKKEIKHWKRMFRWGRTLSQGVPLTLSFLVSEGQLNIRDSRAYMEDEANRLLEKVIGHHLYDIDKLELSTDNFLDVIRDAGTEPLQNVKSLYLHGGLTGSPRRPSQCTPLMIKRLCMWSPSALGVEAALPIRWECLTHVMMSPTILTAHFDDFLGKCVNLEVAIFTINCSVPKSRIFEPVDPRTSGFKMLYLRCLTIIIDVELYDQTFAPYISPERVPALISFRLGYKLSYRAVFDVFPANYDNIGVSMVHQLALVNDFRVQNNELLEFLRRSPNVKDLELQTQTSWTLFVDGLVAHNADDSSTIILPNLQTLSVDLRHLKGSDLSNVRNRLASLIHTRWTGQSSIPIEHLRVLVDEKNLDRWTKLGDLLTDMIADGFRYELTSDGSSIWTNPAEFPRPSAEQKSYLFDDCAIWGTGNVRLLNIYCELS